MRRQRRSKVLVVGAFSTSVCLLVAACGGSSEPRPDEGRTADVERGVAIRVEYGSEPAQFGELTLPADPDPAPVVVLIHGGFWRAGFDLDLMRPLVPSLIDGGFAVWNIDYRAVGAGGGYPATFDDVAAAIDHLASLPPQLADRIDVSRVATVGHSAGGHLAVWAASRASLPADAPGGAAVVIPSVAVSQAGVLDLALCVTSGTGGSACSDIVDALPAAEPLRYARTSPIEMLPIDAAVVLVHGTADRIVPSEQSEAYGVAATAAGVDVELVPVEGADHFAMIDPMHPAWDAVLRAVAALR